MNAPRLLILETSGRRGLIALAVAENVRGVRQLDDGRRNARDLAPAVAELLREQGWQANQLEGVVVSRGPGSYTGLRVGIMSAKTLAFATDCALIGVETFSAIARQVPAECECVDVIGDAQQDKLYVQQFTRQNGELLPSGELAIVAFADWLARRDGGAWVTGPGLHKWRDKLPPDVRVTEPAVWEPSVESLLAVGLARYRADERDDPFALEPLYLRSSSAEIQWDARKA